MPTERDDPSCIVNSDDAGELLHKHNLRAAVIFAVRKDGVVDVATHGDSPFEKEAIAAWAHGVATNTMTTVPFQTAFGVGCAGVPTQIANDVWADQSEPVRQYVDAWTHPEAVINPADDLTPIIGEETT